MLFFPEDCNMLLLDRSGPLLDLRVGGKNPDMENFPLQRDDVRTQKRWTKYALAEKIFKKSFMPIILNFVELVEAGHGHLLATGLLL